MIITTTNQNIMKRGKKYIEAAKKVDRDKAYSLEEAVKLAKETSISKFDGSLEVHMKLGIDPKHAEQQVRSTVVLPHGTGKEVRVVAFVSDDKVKEATAAGAVKAGSDDLIEEINKGFLDFDVAIAMPDMMKSLGKIARTLGQKGLMPNPKAGTVTTEIGKTVEEIKKGKVEFRNDKLSNLHNVVGKISFDDKNLIENLKTFTDAVRSVKPADLKGVYIRSMSLSASMGPGVRVDVSSV